MIMNYPEKIHVFGHEIDVKITDHPILLGERNPDGSIPCIMAQYEPNITTITVCHMEDKPSIGESNFLHEVIEAIDCHGDLKLNHTQISTISSALLQVWKDMPSYQEAA